MIKHRQEATKELVLDCASCPSQPSTKSIVVIGDSHSRIWCKINGSVGGENLLPNIKIHCRSIMSASAQGLINKDSKTGAGNLFLNYINSFKNIDFLMIQVGNVDMDFILPRTNGRTADEQIAISISAMEEYLKLLPIANNKKIVVGVQIPTIDDAHINGYVPGNNAIHINRTNNTLKYNEILKKTVTEKSALFLDINEFIINKETGVFNKEFVGIHEWDNHVGSKAAAIYIQELIKLL